MTRGLCVVALSLLLISQCCAASKTPQNADIHQVAFSRLQGILEKKKLQLLKYCNGVHEHATSISKDAEMLKFFDLKLRYYRLRNAPALPEQATELIEQYKGKIVEHYLKRYRLFYDVLFIAKNGEVFFTIKKEANYQDNLFKGKLANTQLSQYLKTMPLEGFVDFQYFFPSDEPAAFFIQPAYKGKEHLGWFAMQWAVNKLNSLLTDYEDLGLTGEVFLINKAQYALTDSRFFSDSTIMKRHLIPENLEVKFRKRKGNISVVDYRGFKVLSSFEVVPFMRTEYLIIVKRDEDEFVTEQYRAHPEQYHAQQVDYLAQHRSKSGAALPHGPKIAKVDMDEFVKVRKAERLQTLGVSTCTAIIGAYPGKFGYMAHVTPSDTLYNGQMTDLLGQIVKRIKVYDLYKYQRRHVRFVIVANHTDTLKGFIDKLLKEDFLLSQMVFLYNPKAYAANVRYDYKNNAICVEWVMDQARSATVLQNAAPENNLGAVMKQLLKRSGEWP